MKYKIAEEDREKKNRKESIKKTIKHLVVQYKGSVP